MKTIILGCGITGLIATHLIKDSVVFEATDKYCRDFCDESFPKFLEVCPQIDSLFESVGLIPNIAPFDVDILRGGMFIDFFNQHTDKRSIYKDYCDKKYGVFKHGKMNQYMETTCQKWYYSNSSALLSALYDANKDRIRLSSPIEKISLTGRYVLGKCDNLTHFDSLVSTLPVTLFSSLSGVTIDFEKLCLKTVETELEETVALADFVYVPDKKYGFNRITSSKCGKKLSFEYPNSKNISENHKEFIHEFLDTTVIKETTREFVFPVCKEVPFIDNNVHFVGRFATGDYNTKVEDVCASIERLKKTI